MGFCSKPCRIMQDVRINGSDILVPDGIEDNDSPVTQCGQGTTDVFDSPFLCVRTDPLAEEGLCYPAASFMPCAGPKDCPAGEACGFITIMGNLERRCLAKPKQALGLAESCGYDLKSGKAKICESWACSAFGCTQPCESDMDCLTPSAQCDLVTGMCFGQAKTCLSDADCSAWICRADLYIDDFGLYVQACAPRECFKDSDCGDADYYCKHSVVPSQSAALSFVGRCARKIKGGQGLGQPCNDNAGDGLPDVVCENAAYCLEGRCSAMCEKDEDCVAPDGALDAMKCVLRDFASTEGLSIMAPVPICKWVGNNAKPCTTRDDCEGLPCSPLIQAKMKNVELLCTEPPDASVGPWNPCGEAAWGQLCDTGICLDPSPLEPGLCSTVCRNEADCPDIASTWNGFSKFVCEGKVLSKLGSLYLGDDVYVSWCTAVAADSSLVPCKPIGQCAKPEETCRAVVRFGPPSEAAKVSYVCVSVSGKDVGQPCNPSTWENTCKSGVCAPTPIKGVGFCTTPCESDAVCEGLGIAAARCVERIAIFRDPPESHVTVRECRVVDTCVACRDDRDCPAISLRCANVASSQYVTDFRCAPVCESDNECAQFGQGVACREVEAPPETSKAGKVKVCAPIPCP